MKIAFISSIHYPEFTEYGDISFCLSQFVLDNKEYAKYYRDTNKYTIIDNMCAEIGESIDVDKVLQAARVVRANEVWISDKLYDKRKTLVLMNKFLRALKPYDNFKLVGIPQGRNFKQWLECYKIMLEDERINIIGLSKYSCPEAFEGHAGTKIIGKARPVAVKWLGENKLLKKPIHLCGADNFIIEEIKALRKYRIVRSIDSNICFKLGILGIKIEDCEVEPEERLDHNIKNLTESQRAMVMHNIRRVQEVL